MKSLFPICRSITGNGVRETLKIIQKYIPLTIHEIPTGTKAFDWTIPKEWNIDDGYILDSNQNKIIDFKKSNLHVLNYSIPIDKKITFSELKEHIHTLPEQPDAIPYLTSYYNEEWGFCMSHNDFLKLSDEEYHVVIKSTLQDGSLTYGEYYVKGKIQDEFVLTCYVCHPSLCNDNLSGTVLITFIAKLLSKIKPYYSYRFLFIPETIGAIAWLSKNESNIKKIKHGLVATCVGDPGDVTYKRSRNGND
jgi:aminopeptidase-like protein